MQKTWFKVLQTKINKSSSICLWLDGPSKLTENGLTFNVTNSMADLDKSKKSKPNRRQLPSIKRQLQLNGIVI